MFAVITNMSHNIEEDILNKKTLDVVLMKQSLIFNRQVGRIRLTATQGTRRVLLEWRTRGDIDISSKRVLSSTLFHILKTSNCSHLHVDYRELSHTDPFVTERFAVPPAATTTRSRLLRQLIGV
jgi:hypothetical protein